MYLIANGAVKIGEYKGPGMILMTERSLFVFGSGGGASLGGLLGGLVGAVIGHLVDRHRAKNASHLDDPEITELGIRKKLLATKLLAKLPLDDSLSVKPTRLGFVFEAEDLVITYQGWIHKKRILEFLHERGLEIEGS